MQQLQTQLRMAEQRALRAEDRASESQRKVQAWQILQADAARTLSTGWTAQGHSTHPGKGTSLPRSQSLQFQHQPESPVSSLKQAKESSTSADPVHIFRQVYRNRTCSDEKTASLRQSEGPASASLGIGSPFHVHCLTMWIPSATAATCSHKAILLEMGTVVQR